MAQESKRSNRIFVGKLAIDVDQNALKEHFSKLGEIVNIKVKKNSRRNIAYAFINFVNEANLENSVQEFQGTTFNGSEIDVQIAKEVVRNNKRKSNNNGNNGNGNGNNGNEGRNAPNRRVQNPRRVPKKQYSVGNENEKEISLTTLFVSNIPYSIDDEKLKQFFDGFNVKSAHTVTRNGRSKGYGFVEFSSEDDAKSALESKNKLQVEDREINIRNAYKYDEAIVQKSNSTDTLYVSNLPYKLTDEALNEIFKDYFVSKAYVAKTKKGRSKGFGFVVLSGEDTAAAQEKAIAEKNQFKVEDREIFVRAAYNSAEKHEFVDNIKNNNNVNNQNSNEPEVKQIALYVSNIPFTVTSDSLAELFKDTKGFQSANVVVARKNGRSRGYGFVIFDTEEDRDAALEAKKEIQLEERVLSISVARGKKPNNNNINNNGRRNNNNNRRRRFQRRGGRKNFENNDNNNGDKQ